MRSLTLASMLLAVLSGVAAAPECHAARNCPLVGAIRWDAAVAGGAGLIEAGGQVHRPWATQDIAQADTQASRPDCVAQDGRFASAMAASPMETRPNFTSARSYSTSFPLDEDPISEGGKWINGAVDGIDWYNVITRNGVAYGAVSKGEYTDPTALLTGTWGRNQTARAKVFSRNQTEKYYQEVEIRLRSTLAPHRCTGYEVFWRCLKTPNAYVEIVRWNGPVADWTSLRKHTGAQYGVKNGDLVEATIVGNVITGYLDGIEVISATDDTYSAGNPGIGFNYGVEASNVDFGFSYYEVDSYND